MARDIVECFALATYLEENARRQYLAMQMGDPYVFSDAEQQACRTNLWSPALFQKSWDYFRSKVSVQSGRSAWVWSVWSGNYADGSAESCAIPDLTDLTYQTDS